MTYAIWCLIVNFTLLIVELSGQELLSSGADNVEILIAVGIVAICWRLNKLIKAHEQPSGK